MELSAINAFELKPKRFAFIGSGPLPLTSLCIHYFFERQNLLAYTKATKENRCEIVILNIDHSPQAITQSQELCRWLGMKAGEMEFLCAEAESSSQDISDFDVVYLAALVGSSQTEKEDMLVNVVSRMKPGAMLVIRSAERLRRLIYAVCYGPEFFFVMLY
jgi:nicotianamine synthase